MSVVVCRPGDGQVRRWLQFCGYAAWLALMWWTARSGSGAWRGMLNLGVMAILIGHWAAVRLYVLAGDTLTVEYGFARRMQVPLAAAEIKRTRQGWYIRWQDGRLPRALRVTAGPELDGALAERVQAAAAGMAGEEVPSAVGVPGAAWGPALVGAAVAVLTVVLNQPLFLAPMLALPWLKEPGRRYVLEGATLWIAQPGAPPVAIGLGDVRGVEGRGSALAVIRTARPEFPVISVRTYNSAEFLRLLGLRLKA